MPYICDLHLHSKYARACSKNLTLENIDYWCKLKGINIVGSADFTHPAWFKELESKLTEVKPGLYQLRGSKNGTLFMLTAEIACIYSQGGQTRRLHICLWAPNLAFVKKLNQTLTDRGCKLGSDGRPIIGMSAKELLKICLEIDPHHLTIPAHAWTPWFAIFGSKSGFDSIEECYEDLSDNIFAIETGLSSDPPMNWRLKALDHLSLVSNSDAHSLQNLGREANVFDLTEPSFLEIRNIIKSRDKNKFLYTIEFFPEEGMYHFDGHRDCGVSFTPKESKRNKNICPVCKKPLTIGVLNRVEKLADRKKNDLDPEGPLVKSRIPCKNLMPLDEIIAQSLGLAGTKTKGVIKEYDNLISRLQNELNILESASHEDISKAGSSAVAEGVRRLREGKVKLIPGFDGQYGKVLVFEEGSEIKNNLPQKSLF